MLGVTITLPYGWAENPADEGKNGLEAAFPVETGKETNGSIFSADPFQSTMTPHDAVASEVSQPGSGSVVAKGDCTMAGSPAAFFESTVQASVFRGITWVGDGYSVYIAHRAALVHMSVDLPASNGITTPLPRASVMTDVKSILGSWAWVNPEEVAGHPRSPRRARSAPSRIRVLCAAPGVRAIKEASRVAGLKRYELPFCTCGASSACCRPGLPSRWLFQQCASRCKTSRASPN